MTTETSTNTSAREGMSVTSSATRKDAIDAVIILLQRLHGRPVSFHVCADGFAATNFGILEIMRSGDDADTYVRVDGPCSDVLIDPRFITCVEDLTAFHGESSRPVVGSLVVGHVDDRLIVNGDDYEITRTGRVDDGEQSGAMVLSRVVLLGSQGGE